MFNNKAVLPNHQGQTDHQNQINTKLHGYLNRSRQNQGIIVRIQNYWISRMSMRRREPNCGPPTVWVNQTSGREREKLISNEFKQVNWPVNKIDLVNEYINTSFGSKTQ